MVQLSVFFLGFFVCFLKSVHFNKDSPSNIKSNQKYVLQLSKNNWRICNATQRRKHNKKKRWSLGSSYNTDSSFHRGVSVSSTDLRLGQRTIQPYRNRCKGNPRRFDELIYVRAAVPTADIAENDKNRLHRTSPYDLHQESTYEVPLPFHKQCEV